MYKNFNFLEWKISKYKKNALLYFSLNTRYFNYMKLCIFFSSSFFIIINPTCGFVKGFLTEINKFNM